MRKLTNTERAYIAGIIDGEGCVGVYRKKSKSNLFQYDFGIRLIVTNSFSPLLYWLKEKTGCGCVYKYEKAYRENWNLVHRWQTTGFQARKILIAVMPYLKIKKEIARLVLSLPSKYQGKNHGRNKAEYQKQSQLFWAAKEINRRGKKQSYLEIN